MSKTRIDVLLSEKYPEFSREKAKATIMSGIVFANGQRIDKPGMLIDDSTEIEIRGQALEFVSRGGLKLKKALAFFNINPEGKICIDCGASTGGFTDCLLKNGAEKVYSIDVGYGQLAWNLRQDSRVVVMERTNIRKVTKDQICDDIRLCVIDVSFISLSLVLPVLNTLTSADCEIICLIKPQFEAGKGKVGKKGVVRDINIHYEVLNDFIFNAEHSGFGVLGITYSPIKGPEGNIEYLGHLKKGCISNTISVTDIVDASHKELDK